MAREIKFRYTFKRKKDGKLWQSIWSMESIQKGTGGFSDMMNNKLWTIVGRDQFSGFLDKRKNEIFENDFVKYTTENMQCVFNDGGFCFKAKNESRYTITGGNHKYRLINIVTPSSKITGNIYENPELLQK